MNAFVGADRDRPGDGSERVISSGRQGLLHQRNAGLGTSAQVFRQVFFRPGFVGIDDQAGIWRGAPYRRDSRGVAVAAQLDLQQFTLRDLLRGHRHALGRAERDGQRGGDRPQRGKPRKRMDRLAGALGLEIPEGAVECVAGRPGGQGALQRHSVEAVRERFSQFLEPGGLALDRLVVAGEGNAFAPPGQRSVAELRHDHDSLAFGPPADDEGAGDRPALNMDGETDCHAAQKEGERNSGTGLRQAPTKLFFKYMMGRGR